MELLISKKKKHNICPNCSSSRTQDFFKIENAPIQSIVTIKSHEEAMAVPRKDISLSFCHDCGFIFNRAFDTTINHYTQGYEDQQGFSPTFKAFITEITNRFIDRYDVRNKSVLEIGCGKGDFLSLICELGNNKGIGIDPAFVEGRQAPNPNIRFIKELFSEEHGDLPHDVIVCRHTLEHIQGTGAFLKTVRESCTADSIIFVEVPSVLRILKVQAFWDIFYEHCTYMSPGSLARLFRMNGFEVLNMYLEYDEQYLFIEAKPTWEKSTKIHPLEERVEVLWGLVQEFVSNINKRLAQWLELLNKYKADNKKVVIWGGGSKSVGFLTQFHDIGVIEHVIDINPYMTGNFIPGIGIQYQCPDFLKKYRPDAVIIMNGIYTDEINAMLNKMGLDPELHAL